MLFEGACGPSDSTDPNVNPPSSHLDSLSVAPSPTEERGAPAKRVRSQTLYVPAYSHIYIRDAKRSMNLATTLSIRNTSPDTPLTLLLRQQWRVRACLPGHDPYPRPPCLHVRRGRYGRHPGGVGANFILQWHAERPVPPPVVETVMITGANTQGISFRATARVLHEEHVPPDTLGQQSAVRP